MGCFISENELLNNFYFRGGDDSHVFEYGQTQIPEWRGRFEYEVLLDRVSKGLKPVASIVIRSGKKKEIIGKIAEKLKLKTNFVCNDWGVNVCYITKDPDLTLQELLRRRDCSTNFLRGEYEDCSPAEKITELGIGDRKIDYYLRGFDCFFNQKPKKDLKVSIVESALLLGYPF